MSINLLKKEAKRLARELGINARTYRTFLKCHLESLQNAEDVLDVLIYTNSVVMHLPHQPAIFYPEP